MKGVREENEPINVPIWHKANLTIKEAAAYSRIGENSIREMLKYENVCISFQVGNRRLINRELFDDYIKRLCCGRL